MDHFGAGILVLAGVGEGDGDDFAAGLTAFHDDAWVLHGQATADVAIDPFYFGFLVGDASFGDQIEDVAAPVLHGHVLEFSSFHGDQFDHCAVQGAGLEFRSCTSFHVHDFCSFIDDDQGAFELAEVFRINAEVRLERVFHLHAFGDVNEAAPGKGGAVESGKFVVTGGDDFSEPRAENLLVFFESFG